MLLALLLILVTAVLGGGLGLVLRRLDELANEIRELRASLEARQQPAPPRRAQEAARAPASTAMARAEPVRAGAGDVIERAPPPEPLFPASDDPFDDAWVSAAPAEEQQPARREAHSPPAPLAPQRQIAAAAPAFPAPRQSAPYRPLEPWTSHPLARVAAAAALLSAPALPLGAPALVIAGVALALTLALLGFSLRRGWGALAWVAALGGGGWALWASQSLAQTPMIAAAGVAAAGGAAALHARLKFQAGPGLALAALTTGALLMMANAYAAPAPAFAALGLVIAALAVAGASAEELDSLHVGALLGACAGLFVLGGRDEAVIWFAPACAWMGGLFLAIAAVRAPALGARGTMTAATGAIAPILAALALHFAARGLASAWEIAAALAFIAAALTGILALAARRAGGLRVLGWAAFPLGFGAPAALALASGIALPAPFAATALALITVAAMAANMRWPSPIWRFDAAVTGALAALSACGAFAIFSLSERDLGGVLAASFGLAAPALAAGLCARLAGQRAPISANVFESGALIAGVTALFACVRLAYAPEPYAPIGFAEMGLHASVWLALAALLWARPQRGAWLVRQWAAGALAAGALIALALGPLLLLNPLWGQDPEPAPGWPIANTLALGFALPALAALAHGVLWRGDVRSLAGYGAAAICGAVWGLLEIRRAFHGPALAGPASAVEIASYLGAAGLAVIAVTLLRYTMRSNSTI